MLGRVHFEREQFPAFAHREAARLGRTEQICFLQHLADVFGASEHPGTFSLAAAILVAERGIENFGAFVELGDLLVRAASKAGAKIEEADELCRNMIGYVPLALASRIFMGHRCAHHLFLSADAAFRMGPTRRSPVLVQLRTLLMPLQFSSDTGAPSLPAHARSVRRFQIIYLKTIYYHISSIMRRSSIIANPRRIPHQFIVDTTSVLTQHAPK
ncbi:hypothetical protein [Sphingopyxis panaciterrulae]|uniref:Uncharacterized protein n=1 Tax=Sphingopyxis panaciterrulae TaxID=462372 RepID=A0A7W9ER72_9SPHN|nr:hypothetical protein [Sphingopyxis panaciterrulae]MBB5707442.1 hypothetical protein [Sphingopyxis panaciterrulae]